MQRCFKVVGIRIALRPGCLAFFARGFRYVRRFARGFVYMRRSASALFTVLPFGIIGTGAPARSQPLSFAALRGVVGYHDAQISPDGSRVAFVRTTADYVSDELRTSLIIASVDGRLVRTVTSGSNIRNVRWSNDGKRLAYLVDDRKQHAQVAVAASGEGNPQIVTVAANGVQQFAWSPDGTRFAYVTPDDEPNAAAAKRHDDLFDIQDDGMLTKAPPVSSHLWLVGRHGGLARRLTSGTWSVFEGAAPFSGAPSDPSWSNDGRALIFVKLPDAHDAITERSTVASVDVTTGAMHELTSIKRFEYEPEFAHSGTSYVYLRPHGPSPSTSLDAIVATARGGDGDDVSSSLDRDIMSVRWSADASLIALATDGAATSLFAISTSGVAHRLDIGTLMPSEFSVARNGTVALVASTFDTPPEVYVFRTSAGMPAALTHGNAAFGHSSSPRVEKMVWAAPDGQQDDGLLVHPVGEIAGHSYPLIVWMHGGPEMATTTAWDEGTDEAFPFGMFASGRGYYTFMPNYRGSDNLGSAHEGAVIGDPGIGPASDVLSGLSDVLKHAAIDTSKICIGGHSYGGYMTAWIIGHDTRWRCAVVADGVADLAAEYNLAGDGNLTWMRESIGDSPWTDAAEAYRKDSPITYAGAIRTPTMIITGLADETVPYVMSWQLYHALRDNRVPVRLVGIPNTQHIPQDPVRYEAYEKLIFRYLDAALR